MNLKPGGPGETVHVVAFTPKPRMIELEMVRAGNQQLLSAGPPHSADKRRVPGVSTRTERWSRGNTRPHAASEQTPVTAACRCGRTGIAPRRTSWPGLGTSPPRAAIDQCRGEASATEAMGYDGAPGWPHSKRMLPT